MATVIPPITEFILRHVPSYQIEVDKVGRDFFDENSYTAVGALYDLAVASYMRGDIDVVRQSAAAVEEALQSGDSELIDEFSISFIEALATQRRSSHYGPIVEVLGPLSTLDLATKFK